MSNNIYAIPKVSQEEKEVLKAIIDKGNFKELSRLLPQEIHIGTSSVGWEFCFNHNNWKYFGKTKKSLIAFLQNCILFDEYGRDITVSELFELVERKAKGMFGGECSERHDGLRFSNVTDY